MISDIPKIGFKFFLSHKMAHEARMRDMSRFLAQVSLRVAVKQVTAEILLHESRFLLCESPGRLPG